MKQKGRNIIKLAYLSLRFASCPLNNEARLRGIRNRAISKVMREDIVTRCAHYAGP